MGHVFLSFAPEDSVFAGSVSRQIVEAGFEVWPANVSKRGRQHWGDTSDQALRDAFALIVIVTPAATECNRIAYEWSFALGNGARVITLIHQKTALHPRLQALPRLDFTNGADQPWGKLIGEVREASSHNSRRPFTRSSEDLPRFPRRPGADDSSPFSRPGTENPSLLRRPGSESSPPPSFLERLRRRESDSESPDDLSHIEPDRPDTVPKLIEALESDNRDARISAARRLGEIGDRAAIPALIKTLRDEDWRVRDAAAVALGKLKAGAAVLGLLEALRLGRPGPFGGGTNNSVITDAIREIGPKAVPVLVDALTDEDWRIRLYAIDILGQIGDHEALTAISATLRDSEWRVRWRAADALGKMRNAAAVPDLVELLRDSSKDVRLAAAWALGLIGHASAVPGLIKLLDDRDWRVRWAAADALWQIGAESVPGLMEVLRDRDESVRRVAIRALAEIGEPAIPVLLDSLGDSNWDVRWGAAEVLRELGDLAVPHLAQALNNRDWQVSLAVVQALRSIGTPDALTAADQWSDGSPAEDDPPPES